MGASQSSNVSTAIANIGNYVSNSTTANTNQVNQLSQTFNTNHCTFDAPGGTIDVQMLANVSQKSTQIVSALNNNSLQNNIQQQAIQQAMSTVGFAGIGYADAHNASTQIVNSTNQIVNKTSQNLQQLQSTNMSVNCKNSTFIANNIDFTFSNDSDFMANATLNANNTNTVVNDVSQIANQTAKATVEGLSSMMLILIAIILAVVYALTKTLSSAPVKIAIGIFFLLAIFSAFAYMYVKETPPFFNPPQQCIAGSPVGRNGSACINLAPGEIAIQNSPLRYQFPVFTNQGVNLVQMVIASISGDGSVNGGYNIYTMNQWYGATKSYIQQGSPILASGIMFPPNILMNPCKSSGATGSVYYAIPVEYNKGASSSQGTAGASCTPTIVQFSASSTGTANTCSTTLNDTQLGGPISNPDVGNWQNYLANVNSDDWNNYLACSGNFQSTGDNDTIENRYLLARFILCSLIPKIDLNIYINENEFVMYINDQGQTIYTLASDPQAVQSVYKYIPSTPLLNWEANGIGQSSGQGILSGYIGVCDNNQYKFEVFMKKIGIWFLVGMIIAVIFYMGWTSIFKKEDSKSKSEPEKESLLPSNESKSESKSDSHEEKH